MRAWALMAWRLEGDLKVVLLGKNSMLFKFERPKEADSVIDTGNRRLQGNTLKLKRWNPSVGCERQEDPCRESWIRVVGLPVHLWTQEMLKKLGDECGGFVVVDEDTAFKSKLLWARILVKTGKKARSSTVNILAGARSYTLQIWWEIQPWIIRVYLGKDLQTSRGKVTKEEDEGKSRAGRSEWEEGSSVMMIVRG